MSSGSRASVAMQLKTGASCTSCHAQTQRLSGRQSWSICRSLSMVRQTGPHHSMRDSTITALHVLSSMYVKACYISVYSQNSDTMMNLTYLPLREPKWICQVRSLSIELDVILLWIAYLRGQSTAAGYFRQQSNLIVYDGCPTPDSI